MLRELTLLLTGFEIPKADAAIAAACERLSAVGRDRERGNPALVGGKLVMFELRRAVDVPNTRGAIATHAHDLAVVVGESDPGDPVGVPFQGGAVCRWRLPKEGAFDRRFHPRGDFRSLKRRGR